MTDDPITAAIAEARECARWRGGGDHSLVARLLTTLADECERLLSERDTAHQRIESLERELAEAKEHERKMREANAGGFIQIVFDGPPGHESGRFVEVENPARESIGIGQWVERDDGLWALELPLLLEARRA